MSLNIDSQKFLQKLSQLPPEIEFYFGSKLSSDTISKLASFYKLKKDDLENLVIDTVLGDFYVLVLDKKIRGTFGIDEKTAKKIADDLIGMIFLPLADFITIGDIKQAVASMGIDGKKYIKYKQNLADTLENEKIKILDEIISVRKESFDMKKESEMSFDLFSSNFVSILLGNYKESNDTLNGGLINLLFNKQGFKEDLIKIILNNEEIITNSVLVIDGKNFGGSVKNWLNDFIKISGSDYFNNIALVKYLVDSPNGKNLTNEERKKITRLLVLYRNIRFFPKSLNTDNAAKWEIVPSVIPDVEVSKVKENRENNENKKLKELQEIAEQFAPGTLERRAVEEEIRKLGD